MPRIVKFGLIPLLLLIASAGIASLVLADGGTGGSPEAQVVERLIPGEGDKVLQQGQVGIDLLTGWDATLVVNGVEVPDGELERDGLGKVTFTPGDGKAIESFLPDNCVTATYWQIATGPDQSFTRTWCFSGL